jgi:hypothetical protein
MTSGPNLAFWYGVMKNTHFLNSGFFVSCRKMAQACLAFIQFNEADACCLLSAYGLCAFEVDRLQADRSSGQEKEGGGFEGVRAGQLGKGSPRKRLREPIGPMPIGIHPVCWSFGQFEIGANCRRH